MAIEEIRRRLDLFAVNNVETRACVVVPGSAAGIRSPPEHQTRLSREFNMTVLNSYIRSEYSVMDAAPPPSLPTMAENLVAVCAGGEYQTNPPFGDCLPCPIGKYCIGSKLFNCPRGTWSNLPKRANRTDCNICPLSDTQERECYSLGNGTICDPSMISTSTHSYCPDGLRTQPMRGHFGWSNTSRFAYQCANKDSCCGYNDEVGNAAAGCPDKFEKYFVDATPWTEYPWGIASCKVGHTGVLCGTCTPGYYRGRRKCQACSAVEQDAGALDVATSMAIMIPFGVLCTISVVLIYLRVVKVTDYCTTGKMWARFVTPVLAWLDRSFTKYIPVGSGLFKIMLSYCQCIGALRRFDRIGWPKNFDAFMAMIDETFNIEIFTLLPAQCIVPGTRLGFGYELTVVAILPISFFAMVYAILCLAYIRPFKFHTGTRIRLWARCCRPSEIAQQFRNLWKVFVSSRCCKLITFLMLVCYPTLARKFLSIFTCLSAETPPADYDIEAAIKESIVRSGFYKNLSMSSNFTALGLPPFSEYGLPPAAAIMEPGSRIRLMVDDPSVLCTFTDDYAYFVLIALFGIVVYMFTFPWIAVRLIKRWQQSRDDPEEVNEEVIAERYERISFLVSSYEEKYCTSARLDPLHRALLPCSCCCDALTQTSIDRDSPAQGTLSSFGFRTRFSSPAAFTSLRQIHRSSSGQAP